MEFMELQPLRQAAEKQELARCNELTARYGLRLSEAQIAYSVCILPPARYFSATLPNKTRHRAGAVCHCIAGAKALPEVCVLAKPLRQRCNWSINLHRRNWQPM